MPPEIWVAALGALGMIGTAIITRMAGRREREAQVEQITTAAHNAIYAGYADLLEETRATAQAAREEARAAKDAARQAEQRADAAEQRAYDAEYRMRLMERLLTDLRPLIAAHVPGADMWIGQLDRVATMARNT